MCEIAPPPLQLVQTYRTPVPPLCGEVVAMVWLEPGCQENVCDASISSAIDRERTASRIGLHGYLNRVLNKGRQSR